jgi:hypothetical protein
MNKQYIFSGFHLMINPTTKKFLNSHKDIQLPFELPAFKTPILNTNIVLEGGKESKKHALDWLSYGGCMPTSGNLAFWVVNTRKKYFTDLIIELSYFYDCFDDFAGCVQISLKQYGGVEDDHIKKLTDFLTKMFSKKRTEFLWDEEYKFVRCNVLKYVWYDPNFKIAIELEQKRL